MIGLIKLYFFKRKWRRLNKHNETTAKCLFPINSVKIGKATYGKLYVLDAGGSSRLNIGCFCSIGPDVKFVLNVEHGLFYLSTYPFKVKMLGNKSEALSKGNINVGDDVWFGCGAIILSGINIGQGAVIAAGAVVTHDVPPYAVMAGNPAKILHFRFSSDIIKELLNIDFNRLTSNYCAENVNSFYTIIQDASFVRDKFGDLMKEN